MEEPVSSEFESARRDKDSMRIHLLTAIAVGATLLNIALVTVLCQSEVVYRVPEFALHKVSESATDAAGNNLTAAFGMSAVGSMLPKSSVQVLEGDLFVPPGSTANLGIATIGNAFVGGHINQLRSIQAGGHINGGSVDSWTVFNAVPAISNGGTIRELVMYRATFPPDSRSKIGFYADDPEAQYIMRGRIVTDEIAFSNGWKLVIRGDGIQLVDRAGRSRGL
jgi:hypothetical protein